MKAFDSESGLVRLFLFAHPDDEIALCCWIRELVQRGETVHLGWMHTTPTRRAEAEQAAKALGVTNLRFFGTPDGTLAEEMAGWVPKVRTWIEDTMPDRVYTGAFEQGHLDHDATHWIIRQAYAGPIFETPLYHPYCTRFPVMNRFANTSDEEVKSLTKAQIRFKKDYAKSFPSQNIWRNLLAAESRLRATQKDSLAASERLRLATNREFGIPALPPKLAQRVGRSKKWQRWLRALEQATSRPPSESLPHTGG